MQSCEVGGMWIIMLCISIEFNDVVEIRGSEINALMNYSLRRINIFLISGLFPENALTSN